MSARFGRNKRRAASERIAALEQAQTMDRGLLRHQSRTIEYLRDEIESAKFIAGHMSVLFPAEELKIESPPRSHWDVPSYAPMKFNGFDPDAPMMETLRVQRLDVMLASIQEEYLRDAIHIKIRFKDGSWGYALSNTAIHAAPPAALMRHTADALGKMIGAELKGRRS